MNQIINVMEGLSDREKGILRLINDFGFCEFKHVMKRFKMGKSTGYAQMKLLQRLGLVGHRMTLAKRTGAYSLTKKGCKYLLDDLPYLARIPLGSYFHHVSVLDTYIYLMSQYPQAEWKTERHLIRQKYENLAGTKLHLPDGMLVLASKHIAIEVELTLKANERLLDILTDYAIDNTYAEVWYFCSPYIINTIKEISKQFSKIKIHSLNEVSI